MKTISLKKVSAVAVASLGFGLLSVVPAQATAGDAATTSSISSISVTAPTSSTVGAAAAFTIAVKNASQIAAGTADTYKIRAEIATAPTGGISAFTGAFVTVTGWTDASSGANLLAATWSTGNLASGTNTSIGTLSFTPLKAGSYTINFYHDAGGTTAGRDVNEAYQQATITVGAANGYSNSLSTIYTNKLNTNVAADSTTAATNAAPKGSKSLAAARVGTISVSLNTATNTDASAFVSKVEAVISGAGYVVGVNGATPSTNNCPANTSAVGLRSTSITTPGQQVVNFAVCADGTSGTGTYTIKVTDADGVSSTLGTVTATFTDTAKSLAVSSQNYTVAPDLGGDLGYYATMGTRDASTKIPAMVLVTKDANSNAVTWTSNTPSGKSSNTAVLAGGTCAVDSGDATYGSGGAGYYNCYVTSATSAKSGDTATITWRVLNSDGVTYTELPAVTYTIGGKIAKEILSLDKTSYAAGAPMTLTVTATDAAGKPAYDGQAVFAAQTTANTNITGLPTTTLLTKSGTAVTKANTLFAPVTQGSFTIFATGVDTAASALSAIGSVADNNAGLLTQIDALNAKIVALNALIAKIMKKLGVK